MIKFQSDIGLGMNFIDSDSAYRFRYLFNCQAELECIRLIKYPVLENLEPVLDIQPLSDMHKNWIWSLNSAKEPLQN